MDDPKVKHECYDVDCLPCQMCLDALNHYSDLKRSLDVAEEPEALLEYLWIERGKNLGVPPYEAEQKISELQAKNDRLKRELDNTKQALKIAKKIKKRAILKKLEEAIHWIIDDEMDQ